MFSTLPKLTQLVSGRAILEPRQFGFRVYAFNLYLPLIITSLKLPSIGSHENTLSQPL